MKLKHYSEELLLDKLAAFTLSRKAKEAIKVALAMTACYGIALSLDWERPYWAGFVLAFCSLASIGQSLNHAALRMAGTLLGVVVSLALIGLLAQDRWPFILVLLMYVGTCSYIGSGSRHSYFWNVSAIVVVIVSMDAGADPINAFQTAMLRAEETGLGVLVYSLVAIFLWPKSSSGVFNASVVELASIQRQAYQALAKGPGEDQQAQRLLAQGVPHFQRASLAVMKSILLQLEHLTRSLFETVSELKGFGIASTKSYSAPESAPVFVFDQAAENFYRMLGISRGMSESLVDYVQKTAVIDWSPWHEERFV